MGKMKQNYLKKTLKEIDKLSKKKEELWISRVIPINKGRKEKWIISLANKSRKVTEKSLLNSLISVNKINKNSEYWVCEKTGNRKWLCTFYPKATKRSWRF